MLCYQVLQQIELQNRSCHFQISFCLLLCAVVDQYSSLFKLYQRCHQRFYNQSICLVQEVFVAIFQVSGYLVAPLQSSPILILKTLNFLPAMLFCEPIFSGAVQLCCSVFFFPMALPPTIRRPLPTSPVHLWELALVLGTRAEIPQCSPCFFSIFDNFRKWQAF